MGTNASYERISVTAAAFLALDQSTTVAAKMLLHNKVRFSLTLTGIAIAFFLAAAQFGLLVGWINTNSAIIRHAGVDVWVMAPQTPVFDYGTAIPRNRLYQVRSMPGVAWAESLFMAWNIWQRGDGRCVNIELVGLDESSQGGPWSMREGSVDVVHLPHMVIVDELYMQALGVRQVGNAFAMIGQQAIVGGISSGIRTFTASPFIFTSIKSAICLAMIVLMQSLALGGCGIAGGSALFIAVCYATARTPIPLETTPLVFTGLIFVSLLSSGLAPFVSVRKQLLENVRRKEACPRLRHALSIRLHGRLFRLAL